MRQFKARFMAIVLVLVGLITAASASYARDDVYHQYIENDECCTGMGYRDQAVVWSPELGAYIAVTIASGCVQMPYTC